MSAEALASLSRYRRGGYHVDRARALRRRPRERAGDRAIAAPELAEPPIAGDLVHEADAARTVDAPLLVEHHRRSERHRLPLRYLDLVEARPASIVLHVVVLQLALARLIADRAVDRMVDQQELHHRSARLEHLR